MTSREFSKYVSVLLDTSLDKTLDYGIPDDLLPLVSRGAKVEVPLRGRKESGYVIEIKETPAFQPVKGILAAHPQAAALSEDLLELGLWMAKYYCAPLRQVLKAILPAIVRGEMQHKQQLFVMRAKTRDELRTQCEKLRGKNSAQADVLDVMLNVKKGILLTELLEETGGSRSPVDTLAKQGFLLVDIVRVDRSPLLNEEYFKTKSKVLNPEQANALSKIHYSLRSGSYQTHLLHGITGSGKTEVYLQAIEEALKLGKGTIMLVPEISLTAQTIERFRSRFEGKIAILHHRLSQGERFDEWHKIQRGEAQIVIGARSAVFSPVSNLGLIIVDEEHEASYKQTEEMPCYHAREVAVMRGMKRKCTVILGSATPCLESYQNAVKGKYILHTLGTRPDAAALPTFTIVDMKREYEKAKGYTNFSDSLLEGIKKRQAKGEQAILFLNRRGYHTTMLCKGCGKAVRCTQCDVSLTFHLGENRLACHLCGYALTPPPSNCPECGSPDTMKYKGVGTELVEKSLHAVLPEIRTIRLDADTTRHKGSHQKLLRQFASGKADVLIGTQMIAKGLHFPEVTLVGVLNSDSSLNIPDFRASETVFQLITQVAGRAGRGKLAGEVIVQTCLPENTTIQLAASQNYLQFYAEEMQAREMFHYPPFSSLVKLTFTGEEAGYTRQAAELFRAQLVNALPSQFELHAVAPSGHARVKGKYRFQVLIRGPSIPPISLAIHSLWKKDKAVKLHVDVNPLSTFF